MAVFQKSLNNAKTRKIEQTITLHFEEGWIMLACHFMPGISASWTSKSLQHNKRDEIQQLPETFLTTKLLYHCGYAFADKSSAAYRMFILKNTKL